MNNLKIIATPPAINIKALTLPWSEIPLPEDDASFLSGFIINNEEKTRLEFTINNYITAIISGDEAGAKNTLQALLIDSPVALQGEITKDIGDRLAAEKEKQGIRQFHKIIKDGLLQEFNPEHTDETSDTVSSSLPYYATTATVIASLLTFMFIRYETNDFDSFEDFIQPWLDVSAVLREQPIYFQFVMFFASALTLAGPALHFLLKSNPDPEREIIRQASTYIDHAVTPQDLFGETNIKETGNRRFARPAILEESNGGILGAPLAFLENGLSDIADLLSFPLFQYGKSSELTEKYKGFVLLFKSTLDPVKFATETGKEALQRIEKSSRLVDTIKISTIHDLEKQPVLRALQVIKATLSHTIITPKKEGSPFTLMDCLKDNAAEKILDCLRIQNFVPTTHEPNKFIFTPKLLTIIHDTAFTLAADSNSPHIDTDVFITELKKTLSQADTKEEIKLAILAELSASNNTKQVTLNQDYNPFPTNISAPAPVAGRQTAWEIEEPGTELTDIVTVATPHPAFTKSEIDRFTNRLSSEKDQYTIHQKVQEKLTSYLQTTNTTRDDRFNDIPDLKSDAVQTLLELDPFALIAGRETLIQRTIVAIDNYVEIYANAIENKTKLPQPLILFLQDAGHLGKDEYSSGKTSFANAADHYLKQKLEKKGLNTRPAQVLVRAGNKVLFKTKKPIGDAPKSAKTMAGKIVSILKRQWQPTALLATKDLTFLIFNIGLEIYLRENGEITDFTDAYSQGYFSWILFFVSAGLSGINVTSKDTIEVTYENQDKTTLDTGNVSDKGIYTLDPEVTTEHLYGVWKNTPNAPQKAAVIASYQLVMASINERRTLLIENGHRLSQDRRQELIQLAANRKTTLPGRVSAPVNINLMAVTANHSDDDIASEFKQLNRVLSGNTSVFIECGELDTEAYRKAKALLFIHIKKFMTVTWSRDMLDTLIEKLYIKDKEKLFFGIRHIQLLIREAEFLAYAHSQVPFDKHHSPRGHQQMALKKEDLDHAFEKMLDNPVLAGLFSKVKDPVRTDSGTSVRQLVADLEAHA